MTSWKPNLRNACSACCANCGSDLENASSSISCAKTGLLSAPSAAAEVGDCAGLARLKLSAPARQNAISFSCSTPELSPALLCVRISSSLATVPLRTVEGEPVAHVQRVARPRLVLGCGGRQPVAQPKDVGVLVEDRLLVAQPHLGDAPQA